MQLYEHNKLAYQQLTEALKHTDRTCIVQPTGTGKSYIIAKLMQDNPTARFLYISATYFIIDQFKRDFPTLEFIMCDFYIYASLRKYLPDIFEKHYDFIILDEFHRGGAPDWQQSVEEVMKVKGKKIGFSATPIRALDNERNMANELFDGQIAHTLTIQECFDIGILPTPKYVTATYDIQSDMQLLVSRIERSNLINKNQLLARVLKFKKDWAQTKSMEAILQKYITEERFFAVFFLTIQELEEAEPLLEQWFAKAFNIPVYTYAVHSQNPASEEVLEEFLEAQDRNVFHLLLSVEQLNEGIHIKNVEGCIFFRPTESLIIYFQQLGRCLTSKGKQPIVFDLVNNCENIKRYQYNEVTDTTRFKSIREDYAQYRYSFEVIDERNSVIEFIEDIRFQIGHFNSIFDAIQSKLQQGIELNASERSWINYKRKTMDSLTEEQIQKLDSLNSMLGFDWKDGNGYYKKIFLEGFTDIIETLKKKESLNISQEKWIAYKRYRYKDDKLELDEIETLDTLNEWLDFDWKQGRIINFEDYLADIEDTLKQGKELTRVQMKWLNKQVSKYRTNKLSSAAIEAIDTLKLPFDWKKKKREVSSTPFEVRASALKKELDAGKPLTEKMKNFLSYARAKYKKGKLTHDQVQELDSFNPKLGYDWKEGKMTFKSLEEWILELQKRLEAGKELEKKHTSFFETQRGKLRNMALGDDQIALLDGLNPLLGYDWKLGKYKGKKKE